MVERYYEERVRKQVAVMDGLDVLLVTDIEIANKWIEQHKDEHPNAHVVDYLPFEDNEVAQEETPENNEENIKKEVEENGSN